MTVAEKLDLARAEAEEAAASAANDVAVVNNGGGSDNSKGSRIPRPAAATTSFSLDGADESERDDTLGKLPASPVVKKTGVRGRPKKRRKSTLSPEELEELLVMGADE